VLGPLPIALINPLSIKVLISLAKVALDAERALLILAAISSRTIPLL